MEPVPDLPMGAPDTADIPAVIGSFGDRTPPFYFLPPEASGALPASVCLFRRSLVNGRRRLLTGTQTTAAHTGKVSLPPVSRSLLVPELSSMSVVPPNRSQTGWPRGVTQFGNKYIQQTKPLTLERTINL